MVNKDRNVRAALSDVVFVAFDCVANTASTRDPLEAGVDDVDATPSEVSLFDGVRVDAA